MNSNLIFRYASRHGHDDVVNLLLDNGAVIDARDGANRNALSHSSSYGTHSHTTQLLLNRSGKSYHDNIVYILLQALIYYFAAF